MNTSAPSERLDGQNCSLAVHKRLDVESEGGTDAHDILPVQFLENGRLPSIVETASLK